MNTMTIDGWCKTSAEQKSTPIGLIHFHVDDESHLRMEEAEQQLQETHESEIMIDVDMSSLELETPKECGPLSDCQLRVYLNSEDQRGFFHLVGHRANDGSLIYTNSVMVEQLG